MIYRIIKHFLQARKYLTYFCSCLLKHLKIFHIKRIASFHYNIVNFECPVSLKSAALINPTGYRWLFLWHVCSFISITHIIMVILFYEESDKLLRLIKLSLRACLHGGGGPQEGEVTRLGGVTRLSIYSLILIWSRLHDRWGDLPHVTSPTWGPPPPCKQALNSCLGERTQEPQVAEEFFSTPRSLVSFRARLSGDFLLPRMKNLNCSQVIC